MKILPLVLWTTYFGTITVSESRHERSILTHAQMEDRRCRLSNLQTSDRRLCNLRQRRWVYNPRKQECHQNFGCLSIRLTYRTKFECATICEAFSSWWFLILSLNFTKDYKPKINHAKPTCRHIQCPKCHSCAEGQCFVDDNLPGCSDSRLRQGLVRQMRIVSQPDLCSGVRCGECRKCIVHRPSEAQCLRGASCLPEVRCVEDGICNNRRPPYDREKEKCKQLICARGLRCYVRTGVAFCAPPDEIEPSTTEETGRNPCEQCRECQRCLKSVGGISDFSAQCVNSKEILDGPNCSTPVSNNITKTTTTAPPTLVTSGTGQYYYNNCQPPCSSSYEICVLDVGGTQNRYRCVFNGPRTTTISPLYWSTTTSAAFKTTRPPRFPTPSPFGSYTNRSTTTPVFVSRPVRSTPEYKPPGWNRFTQGPYRGGGRTWPNQQRPGPSSENNRINNTSKQEDCRQPIDRGTCPTYGFGQRPPVWGYDIYTDSCIRFTFTGCGGNGNRFFSQPDCLQSCHGTSLQRKENSLQERNIYRGGDGYVPAAAAARGTLSNPIANHVSLQSLSSHRQHQNQILAPPQPSIFGDNFRQFGSGSSDLDNNDCRPEKCDPCSKCVLSPNPRGRRRQQRNRFVCQQRHDPCISTLCPTFPDATCQIDPNTRICRLKYVDTDGKDVTAECLRDFRDPQYIFDD